MSEPLPAFARRIAVGGNALLLATVARAAPLEAPPGPESQTGRAARLVFAQPWRAETDDHFRPATVSVSWSPEALHVRARMVDERVVTAASAHNQRLWQLGDVFEMFFLVQGRTDYLELHVAPNNKRLHLRFAGSRSPSGLRFARKVPFEERLVCPVGFTSAAGRQPDGWWVSAVIPAETLGLAALTPGLHLRVAFARYDADPGRMTVLSSTADHPVPAFHRPWEWAVLRLAPAP